MILTIAKWHGSLALRIPADFARQVGLKAGDYVQVKLSVDGGICAHKVGWDRRAFAHELATMREAMPMTQSVTEELRRGARF